jgi:hypothetical protein
MGDYGRAMRMPSSLDIAKKAFAAMSFVVIAFSTKNRYAVSGTMLRI